MLLTGATGQVGAALLPHLLSAPETRVLALIRAKNAEHLATRLAELRRDLPGGDRLDAVAGDVTLPDLGLSATDRARVDADVTSLLHSAAAVSFDLPEAEAMRQNVGGTEAMLAIGRRLAERGRLRRMDHVSTCYIAGRRTGRVLETEIDVGQSFRNTYEQTKCRSELRVQASGLPISVHRPSIVVGSSKTGATRAFNVLYWPLKIYTRGWWRTFPGRPETPVDVVPVDWLAHAIAKIRAQPETIGKTFHLAAGEAAPSVAEMEKLIRGITGGPALRYVHPGFYRYFVRPLLWPLRLTRRGSRIFRGGNVYLAYFGQNPVFDTSNARAALGQAGGAPPVAEYFETVLKYAMEKGFAGATPG
ncbi:MAG: SDR family oxidoreductase [Deltaproteobacteria bacterium]|nr:SDR family oxidoreductase [Deltaproteobacteria bacterium]